MFLLKSSYFIRRCRIGSFFFLLPGTHDAPHAYGPHAAAADPLPEAEGTRTRAGIHPSVTWHNIQPLDQLKRFMTESRPSRPQSRPSSRPMKFFLSTALLIFKILIRQEVLIKFCLTAALTIVTTGTLITDKQAAI